MLQKVIFFVALGFAVAIMPPEEEIKSWTSMCATELGFELPPVTGGDLQAAMANLVLTPPNRCFHKCMYEKSGFLTGDDFALDRMREMAKDYGDDAAQGLETCIGAISGADLCDKSNNFVACKFQLQQAAAQK